MTPSDRSAGPARAALFWGPLTGLGLAVALTAALIDQASKLPLDTKFLVRSAL